MVTYLTEVVLELLEDAALGSGIALEIIALAEFLDGFFLFVRQRLRYVHADVYHQVSIAASVTLYGGQTLSTQSQCLAGLSTWLHLHLQACALNGRYFYLTAKSSCWEVKQQIVYQVVVVADVGIVLLFLNEHLDIAIDALALTGITLARHVDHHTFGYTSRDLDFYDLLAFLDTCTATVLTLVLDNCTLATAGRTNALCLHHAKDALCGVGDDT